LIESDRYDSPNIYPLIQFANHDEEDKFNPYDFEELMDAILHYRRNVIWLNNPDVSIYGDSVWPYVYRENDSRIRNPFMIWCYMQHASQRKVNFWINENFIPLSNRVVRENKRVGHGVMKPLGSRNE
jgi:hypothetical protein